MGRRRRRTRRYYTLGVKKRICPIDASRIPQINHKDVEFLQNFITEKGKIMPGRTNGLSARNQTLLTRAIKRARDLALLSFTQKHITPPEESPELDDNKLESSKELKDTAESKTASKSAVAEPSDSDATADDAPVNLPDEASEPKAE